MTQPATTDSSNTTEASSSSSAGKPKPKYSISTLADQATRHVDAYLKQQRVSDAMMPRIKETVPPSLLFKALRATVVRILSTHENNHALNFEQENITPLIGGGGGGRKQKVRDQTTQDKRGDHRRQTDKDNCAGVQGHEPRSMAFRSGLVG